MPRKEIHPQTFEAKFVCTVCANEFLAESTKGKDIRVDTCANCHPFYTGKQSFSNTEGKVEKFKERYTKQADIVAQQKKLSDAKKIENEKQIKLKKEKKETTLL